MHFILQENELPSGRFGKLRLRLSLSLYYKLLDAIMKDEERRNPDYGALQVHIIHPVYYTALVGV